LEAALFFLYDQEIKVGLREPIRMPRNLEQHGCDDGEISGSHDPKPTDVFSLRHSGVRGRLTLIQLAQTWLDKLKNVKPFHIQQWTTYIEFLLKTCTLDAEKALRVAEDPKSHHQIIESILHRLNWKLAVSTFICARRSGLFKKLDKRDALGEKATELGRMCKRLVGLGYQVVS
jgi:hypothetical protein